jgi:hypothetical protein
MKKNNYKERTLIFQFNKLDVFILEYWFIFAVFYNSKTLLLVFRVGMESSNKFLILDFVNVNKVKN